MPGDGRVGSMGMTLRGTRGVGSLLTKSGHCAKLIDLYFYVQSPGFSLIRSLF